MKNRLLEKVFTWRLVDLFKGYTSSEIKNLIGLRSKDKAIMPYGLYRRFLTDRLIKMSIVEYRDSSNSNLFYVYRDFTLHSRNTDEFFGDVAVFGDHLWITDVYCPTSPNLHRVKLRISDLGIGWDIIKIH